MFDRHDPRHRFAAAAVASAILHALVLTLPTASGRHAEQLRLPESRLTAVLIAARPAAEPTEVVGSTGAGTSATRSVVPTDWPLPPDDDPFLPSSTLSRPPEALTNPVAENLAQLLGATVGRVVLILRIDRDGRVVNVDVEQSGLPPEATALVATAFTQVHFSPGEKDGRPVRSLVRMEVRVR